MTFYRLSDEHLTLFNTQVVSEKFILHIALLLRHIPLLVTKTPSAIIYPKGKYWERYDENWKCPGCFRKKYECVRPSNKSKWVLEIKSAPFFDEILDVNNQAEPMCIDCMNTVIELGREVIKQTGEYFDFPSSAVSLEKLRQVVIPRPHSKHLFRIEIINQIIPSMTNRFKEFLEQSKIK